MATGGGNLIQLQLPLKTSPSSTYSAPAGEATLTRSKCSRQSCLTIKPLLQVANFPTIRHTRHSLRLGGKEYVTLEKQSDGNGRKKDIENSLVSPADNIFLWTSERAESEILRGMVSATRPKVEKTRGKVSNSSRQKTQKPVERSFDKEDKSHCDTEVVEALSYGRSSKRLASNAVRQMELKCSEAAGVVRLQTVENFPLSSHENKKKKASSRVCTTRKFRSVRKRHLKLGKPVRQSQRDTWNTSSTLSLGSLRAFSPSLSPLLIPSDTIFEPVYIGPSKEDCFTNLTPLQSDQDCEGSQDLEASRADKPLEQHDNISAQPTSSIEAAAADLGEPQLPHNSSSSDAVASLPLYNATSVPHTPYRTKAEDFPNSASFKKMCSPGAPISRNKRREISHSLASSKNNPCYIDVSNEIFSLSQAICSYGFFCLAPNLWVPAPPESDRDDDGYLMRPIRYGPDDKYCCYVTISQPSEGLLRVTTDPTVTSPEYREQITKQVKRMCRLDNTASGDLSGWWEKHPEARRRKFGRLFRSPTLWEDMVKTISVCNTRWKQSCVMNLRLCEEISSFKGSFPSATDVVRFSAGELQSLCKLGYRGVRVHKLAVDICSGVLDLAWFEAPERSRKEVFEAINKLYGFGPFASNNVLMLINYYDSFPYDSETVRHFAEYHKIKGTLNIITSIATRFYEKFAPYQFIAYWFELWLQYERKVGLPAPRWTSQNSAVAEYFVSKKL